MLDYKNRHDYVLNARLVFSLNDVWFVTEKVFQKHFTAEIVVYWKRIEMVVQKSLIWEFLEKTDIMVKKNKKMILLKRSKLINSIKEPFDIILKNR